MRRTVSRRAAESLIAIDRLGTRFARAWSVPSPVPIEGRSTSNCEIVRIRSTARRGGHRSTMRWIYGAPLGRCTAERNAKKMCPRRINLPLTHGEARWRRPVPAESPPQLQPCTALRHASYKRECALMATRTNALACRPFSLVTHELRNASPHRQRPRAQSAAPTHRESQTSARRTAQASRIGWPRRRCQRVAAQAKSRITSDRCATASPTPSALRGNLALGTTRRSDRSLLALRRVHRDWREDAP